MTVKTITCTVAACDAADDCDWWDDDFVPHWESAEQATKAMTEEGWRVDADGRATCPRHVVAALCAAQGHEWGPWEPCRCGGRIAEHKDGAWEWRPCGRNYCMGREMRQVVPV